MFNDIKTVFKIWLHYSCKYDIEGLIDLIPSPTFAMIRMGFSIDYAINYKDRTYFRLEKGALCKFGGTAHLGRGTKLIVLKNAVLEIGDNFVVSASSTFKCFHHIKFESNILFAWNCLVMDSDGHKIFDQEGKRMNQDKDIVLGDNVWIGYGVTILKGVTIPSNCV